MRALFQSMTSSVSVTAIVLALGAANPALAADAPPAEAAAPTAGASAGVAEITVTAQRREQKLQDVGLSITAIGSKDLQKMGIVTSSDLSKAAPGVSLESANGGGVNANLSIRGITQTDFSPNQESPNSLYLDDIYLSSPNEGAFTLYDLNHVEVLRGPQGTLFGRASSGGLVNFLTTRPSKDWNGYADVGYSSYNDVYAEAAVGGPISDTVRFRLAGRGERADGYVHNASGPNAMEKRFYGIRGQIEADLTPDFNARLEVSYDANPTHRDGNYVLFPTQGVPGTGAQPVFLPSNTPYGGPSGPYVLNQTPWHSSFNDLNRLQNHRFSASLYLTANLGAAKVSSITNYTKFGFSYAEDCDGTPINICNYGYSQQLDQFSQELRLNGKTNNLEYTLGAFYLKTRQSVPQTFVYPDFSGTNVAYNVSNNVYQSVDSWAVFGQTEYKFTDQLKLTAGVRYTHEVKSFSSVAVFNELGGLYTGGQAITTPTTLYSFSSAGAFDILGNTADGSLARHSEGLWTGKIQLDYKPVREVLLYAGVSRGAKAAGYNTNVGGFLLAAQTPFRSEYLYAYEAGAKNQLLDNKLRLNLSGFYYEYHHFQGYAFQGLQSVVGNYDGHFVGGEFEIVVAPAPDLDISLSGTLLQTRLHGAQSTYQPAGTLSDEQGTMAPHETIYGSITKRFELPVGTLSATWDGNYVGSRYASIDNNIMTYIPEAFEHNARLSLDIKDKGLTVAVFVNNISNKYKVVFANDATTANSWNPSAGIGWQLRNYDKPRWVGFSIRKTF